MSLVGLVLWADRADPRVVPRSLRSHRTTRDTPKAENAPLANSSSPEETHNGTSVHH